jgi:catechol 2,3-dioxygenase-like lactoylglutathione lyase family enzyme
VLQHVTLEVLPSDIERSVEFWTLLGFRQVEPPPALAETFTWLEREGTQIHLERNESPTVPPNGHAAVVVGDFEQTVERLRERGFEVIPGREHWGAPRAKTTGPGGHIIELMAAPPARGSTENPATRGSVSVRAD